MGRVVIQSLTGRRTMRTMISAVVIFVVSGLICGGVVLGDPLKETSRGPLGEPLKQRVARTLITGRPTIDFGSCPEVEVVQDFDKDAVSAVEIGLLDVCTVLSGYSDTL